MQIKAMIENYVNTWGMFGENEAYNRTLRVIFALWLSHKQMIPINYSVQNPRAALRWKASLVPHNLRCWFAAQGPSDCSQIIQIAS